MVSLADQYERQARWRRFDDLIKGLPVAPGQRVLDLGCGVGTATALLAGAGADVVGVDLDDALLERARANHPGLRFDRQDISTLRPETYGPVDGIFASFVAAYFPSQQTLMQQLSGLLVDGGWLALVEVDDLLGHEPRAADIAADIDAFYAHARDHGGYGFCCGRGLSPALRGAGFTVVSEATIQDRELAFDGAADADVLDAWRARLARMGGMKAFLGPRFGAVSSHIVDALAAPAHRSLCRVFVVVARR